MQGVPILRLGKGSRSWRSVSTDLAKPSAEEGKHLSYLVLTRPGSLWDLVFPSLTWERVSGRLQVCKGSWGRPGCSEIQGVPVSCCWRKQHFYVGFLESVMLHGLMDSGHLRINGLGRQDRARHVGHSFLGGAT